MMSNASDKALRLLDAAFHDLALHVGESEERTRDELGRCGVDIDYAVARVVAHARAALAKSRRARLGNEEPGVERLSPTDPTPP